MLREGIITGLKKIEMRMSYKTVLLGLEIAARGKSNAI